jgi:HECT-domain (ubiquitin-transferase)
VVLRYDTYRNLSFTSFSSILLPAFLSFLFFTFLHTYISLSLHSHYSFFLSLLFPSFFSSINPSYLTNYHKFILFELTSDLILDILIYSQVNDSLKFINFPKKSKIPTWLREIILSSSEDHLRKFLVFVTGSPSITPTTYQKIEINVRCQARSGSLPVAHTCFYHLGKCIL